MTPSLGSWAGTRANAVRHCSFAALGGVYGARAASGRRSFGRASNSSTRARRIGLGGMSPKRNRFMLLTVAVFAVFGAACAGDDASALDGGAATTAVVIESNAYKPAEVAVLVGREVAWTNNATATHTVTADDGESFGSGQIARGRLVPSPVRRAGHIHLHLSDPSLHAWHRRRRVSERRLVEHTPRLHSRTPTVSSSPFAGEESPKSPRNAERGRQRDAMAPMTPHISCACWPETGIRRPTR